MLARAAYLEPAAGRILASHLSVVVVAGLGGKSAIAVLAFGPTFDLTVAPIGPETVLAHPCKPLVSLYRVN